MPDFFVLLGAILIAWLAFNFFRTLMGGKLKKHDKGGKGDAPGSGLRW